MRITFINGLYLPYGAGGAENTLRLLATELARRGHICSIVTLTPEPNAWVGPTEGIPVHYLPLANVYWPYGGPRPRLLRPLFQAADAFNPIMGGRVRRALRLLRPDVVHCHNLPGFSVSAWVAAASLRIPIVQTIHDYYPGCARSTMWRPGRGNCSSLCPECRIFTTPRRALSWLPDAVTCVSHRVFDRLTDNGAFRRARAGIQPVRIIRGNNPYDSASCLYRAAIPPLTLGFLGRLESPKGLEVLLDAVSQLPLKLLVAGTGKAVYEATLRDRAQAHPNVEFIGRVDPEVFFPRIDLLVIPSVWEDPFPRVFHEALAHGVPSLVSPLGGLPEVVQPGKTGFVASGADAASLRAALRTLVERGWDRDGMRRACLAASSGYSLQRIVGQYEAVLSSAAMHCPVPEQGSGEIWRHPEPESPG